MVGAARCGDDGHDDIRGGPSGPPNAVSGGPISPAGTARKVTFMRAETQSVVEEIKQSVGLLRRHL